MVRGRLSSHRKMECNTGSSKLSLPTAVSPRKTPVSPRGLLTSPEPDCNSNNLTMTNGTGVYCNSDKIPDCHEFFQDNSDYQWFLEYGYKDNSYHPHQSVFSILSSHDLLHYDDLARDLDANLAEVDMDDFHREDIHSVLSTLPNMCTNDLQGLEEREMYASMSESMMIKFNFDSCSPRSSSQEGNSNSASMCKSELLFSPVRESYLPNANLSVDSLDLSENDINLLITCQANKNNYTIAFEGSTVMGLDDYECPENGASGDVKSEEPPSVTKDMKSSRASKHIFNSNLNNSMVRSDSIYTTWSKIKQLSNEHLQLRQQISGNNNPRFDSRCAHISRSSNTKKSLSLPNLFHQKQRHTPGLSMSSRLSCDFSSGSENGKLLTKLQENQKSNLSANSGDQSSSNGGEDAQDKPPNLNLVKLFIKQKSASHEGMCNYICDRPVNTSYSEIYNRDVSRNFTPDNSLTKDCQTDRIEVLENGPLKNHWTPPQYKKFIPECSISGFEDSLMTRNTKKNETVQEKENSDSESVDPITESSKQISESVEQITESCNSERHNCNAAEEPSHKTNQRFNECAFNVNNNNSVLDNHKSKYMSDESTQENGSNTESAEHVPCSCRAIRPAKTKMYSMEKSIQTSKLLETGGSAEKREIKIPAYILYPNYSLPNLEFLKEKHYVQNIDFTKIFLRPQTYKQSECSAVNSRKKSKIAGKRPFSVNDIETLKKTGFKHVRDWDSLTFLLPKEYKEFLQEIPEITDQLKDAGNMRDDLRPLFCLNTERKKMKRRPMSCDSNFFSADCRSSNFSSTATQPSSGYRGSSTMLNSNNSTATPSPRNPSFCFKYDSNDSVFSSRKNVTGRGCSTSNELACDEPPPRPPLPRGILRNNSLDNTKYTCKTQKENANKRYSMIEFGEKNLDANVSKMTRRRSAQDAYYMKSPQKNSEFKPVTDSQNGRNYKLEEEEENCLSFNGSGLDSDMRRLEELLEISNVFGESIESFTEQDMLKLRTQVSKFLTMQKNLQKVSECLQTVNETSSGKLNNVDVDEDILYKEKPTEGKSSLTPNNTPEHKRKRCMPLEGYESDMDVSLCVICNVKNCQNLDHWEEYGKECNYKEDTIRGLKKTVSFAEKISLMKEKYLDNKDVTPPNSPIPTVLQASPKTYQGKPLKLVDTAICEESYEGSLSDSPQKYVESNSLIHKKVLVLDVRNAVEKIIFQWNSKKDEVQGELSNICLHHLCPSLYAILSDGLKEEIDTPFGPIRNSVWSVIEATSRQGPLTETLNHLVQRLNSDDVLTEGLVKFNAFIFGLLNVNSLDAWLSYLRTRDSLLHRYYHQTGLLLLSNSAGPPVRALMDHLIQITKPLTEVKFVLDLMYQAKLLHCSLQNLNSLLEATNNDLLSPTKHLMLLKLVQSIQNSINQPSEGRRNRHLCEEIEKLTNDPPVTQLLEKSLSIKPRRTNRPRPRSGCDILSADNPSDVAGSMKKRWSGVQSNSKLLQAFERLREEAESDYTDSLDNARGNRGEKSPSSGAVSKRLQDSDNTFDDISHTWNNDSDSSEFITKEQRKNILSNLNKKNSRVDESKTDKESNDRLMEATSPKIHNGGHKFKRLQQKWEKLSGKSGSDCSSGSSSPVHRASPVRTSKVTTPKRAVPDRTNGSNVTLPSPTSKISRIPRPVSSPSQVTPTSEKQCVTTKKLVSPTLCVADNSQKGSRSGGNNLTKNEAKTKSYTGTRLSRFDETSDHNTDVNTRSRAVRPSSLPYRGVSTMPVRRNAPARASSMSLNRKAESKSLNTPRFVRTLSHRLPSDSGHLSFNEGEKLKVVLEVDETWILCCRGTQKGLVPKSAVIPVPESVKY